MFFLHHTMVDRILAMWQVLHPDSWVPQQITTVPSFTIDNGTLVDATTPLAPFFSNANGEFWDSDTARYTEAFGYSYQEARGVNGSPDIDRVQSNRARLSATINRLYGASNMAASLRKRADNTEQTEGWTWAKGFFEKKTRRYDAAEASSPRAAPATTVQHHYTEWLANIRVENGAMNGSFSICFFLGEPPQDVQSWKMADNLVGTMGIFAMKHMQGRNRVSGTVPLTSSLNRALSTPAHAGLETGEAHRYLRQNLHFRVSGVDGEIDPAAIRGLCIDIASSEVTLANHERELPHWGPVEKRFIMFC